MDDEEDVEIVELFKTVESLQPSSLMVNVDYLELVDRNGEEKAWEILGKLKDLLG